MIEILVNYYADGNKARFSALLGIKPQTLSMWLTRNSFDAELLFTKCEDLSGDWLLSGGQGDMLRSVNIISADHSSIAAGGNVNGGTTIQGDQNNYSDSCCERDNHFDERIVLLEKLLEEKERTIQILMEKIKL